MQSCIICWISGAAKPRRPNPSTLSTPKQRQLLGAAGYLIASVCVCARCVKSCCLSLQIEKLREDLSMPPNSVRVHCDAVTLRSFMSYMVRRHDGAQRKAALQQPDLFAVLHMFCFRFREPKPRILALVLYSTRHFSFGSLRLRSERGRRPNFSWTRRTRLRFPTRAFILRKILRSRMKATGQLSMHT